MAPHDFLRLETSIVAPAADDQCSLWKITLKDLIDSRAKLLGAPFGHRKCQKRWKTPQETEKNYTLNQ